MSDPNEKFEDLIDPGESDTKAEDNHDPFAPPPPKGTIFHHDDSEPDADSFSVPTVKSPWPGHRDNIGDMQSDEKYDYKNPTGSDTETAWMRIVRHPIVNLLILTCIVVGFFTTPRYSMQYWLMVLLVIIYIPYTITYRPRWHRRYNVEWEADAEPTGCLTTNWRWWR